MPADPQHWTITLFEFLEYGLKQSRRSQQESLRIAFHSPNAIKHDGM